MLAVTLLFALLVGICLIYVVSNLRKCFFRTADCKPLQTLKKVLCDLLGYNLVKLLFLASIVFFIHHKTDLLKPFDDMSVTLINICSASSENKTQNLSDLKGTPIFKVVPSSDNRREEHEFYVMLISKCAYLNKFLGVSPLDRCALSEILTDILDKDPQVLAIDIDLSPIYSNNRDSKIYTYYQNCQRELDRILKSHAKKTKIILIDPSKFQELNVNSSERNVSTSCLSSWKEEIEKWKKEMEKAGIDFADPTVFTSLGIALYYPINSPSLGKEVAEYLEAGREDSHEHHHSKIPINFKVKVEKVTDITNHSVVFFGGAYSSLDKFETPIGKFPGVFIHAFGALSILNPTKESGLLAYAADVAIAILTFIVINYILLRSFDVRSFDERKKRDKNILKDILSCIRDFFYNTYSVVLLAVFCIVFISLVLTIVLYKHFGILISPIPIVIGVLLDGLFGIILENLEKRSPHHSFNRFNTYCKAGIMLGFIAYSPFVMVHKPELFVLFILIPGFFIYKVGGRICKEIVEE